MEADNKRLPLEERRTRAELNEAAVHEFLLQAHRDLAQLFQRMPDEDRVAQWSYQGQNRWKNDEQLHQPSTLSFFVLNGGTFRSKTNHVDWPEKPGWVGGLPDHSDVGWAPLALLVGRPRDSDLDQFNFIGILRATDVYSEPGEEHKIYKLEMDVVPTTPTDLDATHEQRTTIETPVVTLGTKKRDVNSVALFRVQDPDSVDVANAPGRANRLVIWAGNKTPSLKGFDDTVASNPVLLESRGDWAVIVENMTREDEVGGGFVYQHGNVPIAQPKLRSAK